MPSSGNGCELPWRLLVLDVDGVLTDGTKMYDRDGRVFGKAFNDKDFTAIRRFQDAGVKVCLLSADQKVNQAIAHRRALDFHHSRNPDGSIHKAAWVTRLAHHYEVAPAEMAYVGDDFHDLEFMREVGHSFCPRTAPRDVRDHVTRVLRGQGGDGLVAELFDLFLDLMLAGGKVQAHPKLVTSPEDHQP